MKRKKLYKLKEENQEIWLRTSIKAPHIKLQLNHFSQPVSALGANLAAADI